MMLRCYHKSHCGYKNYGARGITVCEEWQGKDGFINFKKWSFENGFKEELELDRIDNNGNYSPDNCRWIDRKTNMRNRRNNVKINNKTLAEISEETGVKYSTLESRYKACGDIILKEKQCEICNKKFMPQYFNQRFCSSECRDKKYNIKIEILLKDIRKRKKLNLEQLAEMTGISKSHLNYIENNQKEPTLTILVKIADALEIDLQELYTICHNE